MKQAKKTKQKDELKEYAKKEALNQAYPKKSYPIKEIVVEKQFISHTDGRETTYTLILADTTLEDVKKLVKELNSLFSYQPLGEFSEKAPLYRQNRQDVVKKETKPKT